MWSSSNTHAESWLFVFFFLFVGASRPDCRKNNTVRNNHSSNQLVNDAYYVLKNFLIIRSTRGSRVLNWRPSKSTRGPAHAAPRRHVDMLHLGAWEPLRWISRFAGWRQRRRRKGKGKGSRSRWWRRRLPRTILRALAPRHRPPVSFAAEAESDAAGPEQNTYCTYPSSPSMKPPPAGNQMFLSFAVAVDCSINKAWGRKDPVLVQI